MNPPIQPVSTVSLCTSMLLKYFPELWCIYISEFPLPGCTILLIHFHPPSNVGLLSTSSSPWVFSPSPSEVMPPIWSWKLLVWCVLCALTTHFSWYSSVSDISAQLDLNSGLSISLVWEMWSVCITYFLASLWKMLGLDRRLARQTGARLYTWHPWEALAVQESCKAHRSWVG